MFVLTSMRRAALAASLGAIAAGCSDQTGPVDPVPGGPAVATVSVSPPEHTLLIGETVTLAAAAFDAQGRPVLGRTVRWSAEPANLATVSNQGVVTGVAEGAVTVSATVDGKRGSSAILVLAPTVASVDLNLTQALVDEGGTVHLAATPRDAYGAPIAGRGIVWTSSEPDIAAVAADGMVTALRPGAALVTARVHGKTASATVTVEANHAADLLFSRVTAPGEQPELLVLDPRDPARIPRSLAGGGVRGREAAPSPDGSRIAYVVVDPWARTDIHVLELATGRIDQLTSGPDADDQPKWSPDGSRLAFRRRVTGQASHIWVADVFGLDRQSRNLTASEPGSFASPAWAATPAGDRIAYSRSLNGFGTIWTMAANGTDKRQVTNSTTYYDDEPAWSPDGTTIAFTRVGGPSRDIWLVGANGGGERVLVALVLNQFQPAWSPDGKLIAFTSNHEGAAYEIYTAWTTGAARLARRTADGLDKGHPIWVRR